MGRAKCGAYRGGGDGGPSGEAGPWSGVLVGRDAARVKWGASFSEQAEPRWARSDGAAAAVRGKMD